MRTDNGLENGRGRPAALDAAETLWFEDIEIGQAFVSGARRVEAESIKAFARTYDPQPFHLDEGAAENTFFEGLAASGWHTAAITMRLLVKSLPIAGGLVGAGVELFWPKPTRPGDVLMVESEIVEVRPSQSRPDRGLVRVRSLTRNQRGDVVQDMTSTLIVPRRE
jgi:acyl dehydratase